MFENLYQKSILRKIIIVLFITGIIVFGIQIYINSNFYYNNVKDKAENHLLEKLNSEAQYLNSLFSSTKNTSKHIAALVENDKNYNEELLLDYFKNAMEESPLIVGGGVWMEPNKYKENEKYFGPYIYRDNNSIEISWEYSNEEGNYFQYDWYKDGLGKEPVWSEPYKDQVTGVPMITVSTPIRINNKAQGVVTLDLGMEKMKEHVNNLEVGDNGQAFIVSNTGKFIVNNNHENSMEVNIQNEEKSQLAQYAGEILDSNKANLREATVEKLLLMEKDILSEREIFIFKLK